MDDLADRRPWEPFPPKDFSPPHHPPHGLPPVWAARTSDSRSGIELHIQTLCTTVGMNDQTALSLIKDLVPAARLTRAEREDLIAFIGTSYAWEDAEDAAEAERAQTSGSPAAPSSSGGSAAAR